MKNYSIPIEHKDEAIRLFEQLGYKENKWWNEATKSNGNTHILTHNDGTWAFYNHKGRFNTPVTIEELRELAGDPVKKTPPKPNPKPFISTTINNNVNVINPELDKIDLLIQQMRELRAELREFMKEEKPSEVREWKVGNRVRITKKESHGFKIGDVVELIEHNKHNDNDIYPWLAKSQSGVEWWLNESEADLITE